MTLFLALLLGRSIGNDAFRKPFQGSLGQRRQNHHLPLEMLLRPQKLPRRLHTHGRLSGNSNSPETASHWDTGTPSLAEATPRGQPAAHRDVGAGPACATEEGPRRHISQDGVPGTPSGGSGLRA